MYAEFATGLYAWSMRVLEVVVIGTVGNGWVSSVLCFVNPSGCFFVFTVVTAHGGIVDDIFFEGLVCEYVGKVHLLGDLFGELFVMV